MPRILISYRREDSAAYAGRLYDHLTGHFGPDNVFMDVATIRPGQDFVEVLEQSVGSCDAVVAVIGKHWLTSSESGGARRLDQPDDFVRREIGIALTRHITVVPVLVGGAAMPRTEELPSDLAALSRRQALEITDTRFREDVEQLVNAVAAQPSAAAVAAPERRGRSASTPRWGVALAVLGAAIAVASYWQFGRESRRTGGTDPVAGQVSRLPGRAAVPAGANGTVDNPRVVEFGATYKVSLDQDEDVYFRSDSPAGDVTIVLDSSRADGAPGNLIHTLSLLDEQGVVIERAALRANQIDTSFREVGAFPLKRSGTFGIKLSNGNSTVNFWLTVFKGGSARLLPFFGERVPAPLAVGRPASGMLEKNADVFYAIPLTRGEYTAVLDFSRPGGRANLIGYLAVLDADGGNQRSVLTMNEIGVSHRAAGTWSMKRDGTAIVRIQNRHEDVNYSVRIAPGP